MIALLNEFWWYTLLCHRHRDFLAGVRHRLFGDRDGGYGALLAGTQRLRDQAKVNEESWLSVCMYVGFESTGHLLFGHHTARNRIE